MAKQGKRTTFQDAVKNTPSVSEKYHRGLQALNNTDQARIKCENPQSLAGSINLDEAIRQLSEPNSPVWDYGIGYRPGAQSNDDDEVYWVEVHSANSKHVTEVITKLRWLQDWLQTKAIPLSRLKRRFVWIASGAVALPANSPQRKLIARHGIHFAGSRLAIPLKTE